MNNLKKIEVDINKINNEQFKNTIFNFLAYKNRINFKFIDYFKYFFCSFNKIKNRKQMYILKMLDLYNKKIYRKFDVFRYLKHNREIDIFKKLFYNEGIKKQLKVFSKKLYSINLSEKEDNQEDDKKFKKIRKEDKIKIYLEKNIEIFKQEKLLKLLY